MASTPLKWEDDILIPAAPQWAVDSIFIPCIIGWGIQFYLSGITTDRTVRLLRRRNVHKITTTPLARPLLMIASAGNFFVGVACIANMAIYILAQDRSSSNLQSYKWPDLLGPAIGIPCSVCTQAYFAIRCWKVTERNRYIAVCMALSILVGLVGSSWSTAVLGLLVMGRVPTDRLFMPTVIYLVGNIVADVTITVVFTVHLIKMKRVSSRSNTGNFVNSLIRLAFESCAVPTAFILFTAVMRVLSTTSTRLNHMASATLLFIPSLYLFSFIYCIEGTAARKRQLEKDRASVENGRAIIITTHNRNRRRQETNDDSHLSSKILSGTSGSRSRSAGSGSRSGGTSDTLNNSTMSAIERQRERDKEREKTQYVWEPPVLWQSSLEEGNIDHTRTSLSRQEIPFADYVRSPLAQPPVVVPLPGARRLSEGHPRPSQIRRPSFPFHLTRSRQRSAVAVQVVTVETVETPAYGEEVALESPEAGTDHPQPVLYYGLAQELDLTPLQRLSGSTLPADKDDLSPTTSPDLSKGQP